MSKTIPLTQGHHTIVDDDDYDFLVQWKWYYAMGYAQRSPYCRETRTTSILRLHNALMQPPSGFIIDHRSGDKLDNRRSNLRLATRAENNRNAKARIASSAFKGVYRHGLTGKWAAHIQTGSSRLHLGLFVSEIEAAEAYDCAARRFHGEYAVLNFDRLPPPARTAAERLTLFSEAFRAAKREGRDLDATRYQAEALSALAETLGITVEQMLAERAAMKTEAA